MNFKNIIKNIIPWMNTDKKIYKKYYKSHKYALNNRKILAFYYRYKNLKKYGCVISPYCDIGKNLSLPHPLSVVIGGYNNSNHVKIGDNCTIYQGVTIGQSNDEFPIIGNNVTIYSGAKVIGNVKVGNNVIIGANAVVINDIPDNCVVAGVPAKVIKEMEAKNYERV